MTEPNDDLEHKPVSDYFNQAINALSSGQADRPKRDDDEEGETDAVDETDAAPAEESDPAAEAAPAPDEPAPAPVMARPVAARAAAAPRRMKPSVDPALKALALPRAIVPSLLCLGIVSLVLGGLQYTLAPESAFSAANSPRIAMLRMTVQQLAFVIGGVLLLAGICTMMFIRSRLNAARKG